MEKSQIKEIKKEIKGINSEIKDTTKSIYQTLIENDYLEFAIQTKGILKSLKKYPTNNDLLSTVKSVNDYIIILLEEITNCVGYDGSVDSITLQLVLKNFETICKSRASLNKITKRKVSSFTMIDGIYESLYRLQKEIDRKHKKYLEKFSDESKLNDIDKQQQYTYAQELETLESKKNRLLVIANEKTIIKIYEDELNQKLQFGKISSKEYEERKRQVESMRREAERDNERRKITIEGNSDLINKWNTKIVETKPEENKTENTEKQTSIYDGIPS